MFAMAKLTVVNAKRTIRALSNGQKTRTYKVRTGTCEFVNPPSLIHPKAPKYERKPIANEEFDGSLNILRYPVRSEAVNRLIENQNTVVFIVRRETNKPQIKKAFETVFGIRPDRVNTLITPLGEKKAFIKLPKNVRAEDVAAGFTPK